DFILTNGFPGTADTGVLQAHADEHDQKRDQQEQVIVFLWPGNPYAKQSFRLAEDEVANLEGIDPVDPLRAVGDIDGRIQVVHEDADNFTEAQGHNRQVIASQAQDRKAQQHTEYGSQGDTGWQYHPERQVQAKLRRCQHGPDIRPYGVEGDIAQIQQTSKTPTMFRPRASITYSRAKFRVRIQL